MEVWDRVMNKICNLEPYSATTDLRCSQTTEPYISLTIHFIDDYWNLHSRLETTFFPDDHTREIIVHGLKDALSAWGLDEARLVCAAAQTWRTLWKSINGLTCFGHRLHTGKLHYSNPIA